MIIGKQKAKTLLALTVAVILVFTVFTASLFARERPNIVLIMVDDLGYDDLSGHGNQIVHTPNLDELSETSVRFLDFNVAPVCAPKLQGAGGCGIV